MHASSGVFYVVENRHLIQRAFPDLLKQSPVRNVSDYDERPYEAFCEVASERIIDPQAAVLFPGAFNAAYFEYIFIV